MDLQHGALNSQEHQLNKHQLNKEQLNQLKAKHPKQLPNKPQFQVEEDSKLLVLRQPAVQDKLELDKQLLHNKPQLISQKSTQPQLLAKMLQLHQLEDTETEEIEDTTDEPVTLFLYESVSIMNIFWTLNIWLVFFKFIKTFNLYN